MTENGEPIHELGIQDAEGNFTALAALDYDTVNDELSLKHLQENVELRTDGTSWNPNVQIGDETQPAPGTSHFNAVSTDVLGIGGIAKTARNDAELDDLMESKPRRIVLGGGDPDFSESRTFDWSVCLLGQNPGISGAPTRIDGTDIDWTFQQSVFAQNVYFRDVEVIIQSSRNIITSCGLAVNQVTVQDNETVINGCISGDVVFESGTSQGIVDSCSGTTVTDNGTNTVGDIA